MEEKKRLGNRGEDLVAKYLSEHGHTILHSQYRAGHLEVDVISLDVDGLHFVEVKTRREPVAKDPLEAVNQTKRRNIINAAKHYLQCDKPNEIGSVECFFDIAVVLYHVDGTHSIAYYPKAYTQIKGFCEAKW